jgi:hypothetical protein
MKATETVFYAVVAPRWRAPYRPVPGLGSRRPLRWQVVRETRRPSSDGISTWAHEHHSLHWTWRSAWNAAQNAEATERARRQPGLSGEAS